MPESELISPPTSTAIAKLGHARALDGLRGVAVLAVVGHNFGWPWLRGGFFGVDIFFALSGFLITTLLLEEYLENGSISLREFFLRRVVRLYPALVILIAASAFSLVITDREVPLARVALVLTSELLYFANWVATADSQAWTGGMSHMWSLAVEVHFYLFWALMLWLITRYRGIEFRILTGLAVIIAITSFSWRCALWGFGVDLNRLYAGTDTRLDAIFLGVIVALCRLSTIPGGTADSVADLSRWAVRTLELLLVTGMGWLLYRTNQHSPIPYLGGYGLVGGATALLILTTLTNPHSILVIPLQHRLLVWFGHISYSLYLWHLPVGKFVSTQRLTHLGMDNATAGVLRLFIGIAVAAASYYGVERVFLRWRRRIRTLPAGG